MADRNGVVTAPRATLILHAAAQRLSERASAAESALLGLTHVADEIAGDTHHTFLAAIDELKRGRDRAAVASRGVRELQLTRALTARRWVPMQTARISAMRSPTAYASERWSARHEIAISRKFTSSMQFSNRSSPAWSHASRISECLQLLGQRGDGEPLQDPEGRARSSAVL